MSDTQKETKTQNQNIISTSYDLAVLLHSMYKDEFVCASIKNKSWYKFENHRWHENDGANGLYKKISIELIQEFNKTISFIKDIEDTEQKISMMKEAGAVIKKLKSTSFKRSIIEECQHLFYDAEFINKLDDNRDLLCFNNGVFDLSKMKFRDGVKEDYLSLCTHTDYQPYNPKDESQIELQKYFSQVFIEEDMREYVIMLLTSYIQGNTPEEKFHIWTGEGSNSKSKLIELFSSCLGDYAGIFPVSLLTQKRSACGVASPEMAKAKGKRFMTFSEAEEGDQIRVGLLKELTGGDLITARPLFREPIEFKPQFKLLLTCNKLPHIPSSDGGTWRRLRVVPFKSKFTSKPDPKKKNEFKIDQNLNKRFEIWKETLMSLLIHKFSDYKRYGVTEPAEVLKFTNKYKADTDLNFQFIQDNIEKTENKNDFINMNELFSTYKIWYKESGITSKIQPRKTFKEYFETNYKDNLKRNHLYGFKFANDDNQLSNDLDS